MVTNKRTFSSDLERRARSLVAGSTEDRDQSPIVRSLVREVELVLAQIDTWHGTQERVQRSLLRVECYTDTELMQMEARTPRYSPYRFPERAKLQRRLFDIEKERRRLTVQRDQTLAELQTRLLSILEKHVQLTGT